MAIHVVCTRCGNPAPTSQPAGDEACCFHCGATLKIPPATAAPAPPPLPAELPVDAGESESRPSVVKSALMLSAAFSLGALLCGVFVAGFILGGARNRETLASAGSAPPAETAPPSEAQSQASSFADASREESPPSGTTAAAPVAIAATEDNATRESPAANENDSASGSEAAELPPESAADQIPAFGPAPNEEAIVSPAKPEAPPGMRNWNDVTGSFSVVAGYVGFDDKLVRLRMQDEKIVAVPIDRLSEADQKFVLGQPPEASIDLPPGLGGGGSIADSEPETAVQAGADLYAPLFGNAQYNPPPRTTGRPRPKLDYPEAEERVWTPYSHDPFLGVFHNLEAGRLSIRIHNGIVLNGPVLDMSRADLEYIQSIMGEELFQQEVAAPPAAFAEPTGQE